MVIKSISVILKNILTDLSFKNYSNADITKLVHISRAILVSYIRNSFSSAVSLCHKQGISINDIAIDCIAEVFQQTENNHIPKLESYFSSLRSPISEMPDKEIFLTWKALLIKIAKTQIAHTYAQYDPSGFKIQRNIKEVIAHIEFFNLYKNVNGIFLIIPTYELFNSLPPINAEDIESDFLFAVKEERNTKNLLKILHDLLIEQSRFRKEIKLTEAVKLFKKVFNYTSDDLHYDEEYSEFSLANSFAEEIELEQICSKVLENVKEKILVNYLFKGKLTTTQSEAIYLTIDNLVLDWRNSGNNNSSLYEHFKKFMEISESEYELLIKAKIEYLVKITKREFSLYLFSNEK
ncbi:MAG: hypothetical protein WC055_03850 [Melioribacteraceae bacterium]